MMNDYHQHHGSLAYTAFSEMIFASTVPRRDTSYMPLPLILGDQARMFIIVRIQELMAGIHNLYPAPDQNK